MSIVFGFLFLGLLWVGIWYARKRYSEWQAQRLTEAYREWRASQRYTILRVLPPKNNEKTPLSAEQMFAAIHGIFRESALFQDEISFELVAHNKFIHFYVHVPVHLKEFVEGQIYAQYPSVEITEVEDYTQLLDPSLAVVGGELTLTKDYFYPIQTFQNFTVDPLSGITGVLGNISERQQVWIQFIVKPVPEEWQEKGIEFVAAKRLGVKPVSQSLLLRLVGSFGRFLLDAIRTIVQPGSVAAPADGGGGGEEKSAQPQLSAPEEAALKGIEAKITKLGYETKMRILVAAEDPYTSRSKVEAVTGAFKQFNSTNMNGFRLAGLGENHGLLHAYRTREFQGGGMLLNTEELASVYHLPALSVETPNISWAGSKKGEPPSNLPIEGKVDETEVTYFGTTDFRSFKHKFGIKPLDRRLHTYVIGKTGTGKSTLLQNMIVDDIHKGRGVAVVDPHGQLVQDVLNCVPAHRIKDVVYFNAADRDFPIGFNVLESVNPDLRTVVASGVVGIFKKLFAESWGPRLEYILRNTVLALLEYPDSTLLGVNRLLVDKDFRKKVVQHITDPVIKDYFENEFERYDPKFRTEAIAPIQNKVGQFLSSSTIRNIIGQPKSAINIRNLMDTKKILLMDLSIGRIGEDSSALLGALLITQIQLSAMGRADVAEDQRPDFYLYVDEFQNFATDSFAVILSEARKYHLNLVLTNQYIAQMPETVAHAIFGNVGTMISFRVGPGDASGLVKEFEPVFEAIDLVNLDNHHIYVKMAIDGVTRPAFSASTLPPQRQPSNNAEKVITASRERFGKPKETVEQQIRDWSEEGRKAPTGGGSAGDFSPRTTGSNSQFQRSSSAQGVQPRSQGSGQGISAGHSQSRQSTVQGGGSLGEQEWYVVPKKEPSRNQPKPSQQEQGSGGTVSHKSPPEQARQQTKNQQPHQTWLADGELEPGDEVSLRDL